jgi:tripartite-type tricarboxylate transporter receptor subunit TctC
MMLFAGQAARHSRAVAIAASLLAMMPIADRASAADNAGLFAGKQIRFIVPAGAGGGYDLYMRLLSEYLGRFIPGSPGAVVINMPGGGGVKATNYVYNVAPKDGTVLGMPFFNLPLFQLVRPAGIKFDMRKFGWVGNMAELNSSIVVMTSSSIRTIEDAKKRQVILGSSGKGSESYIYPQLCNALLDTRFKMVLGYTSTAAMTVAMERGELQGRGGSWLMWPESRPDWVREGKVHALVQAGRTRDPALPDVPLITELVTEKDKPIARFVSSAVVTARMVELPPGVSDDVLQSMRRAFDETMKDPKFLSEAKRRQIDLRPMSGAQLQAEIEALFRTPKSVVAQAKAALGY